MVVSLHEGEGFRERCRTKGRGLMSILDEAYNDSEGAAVARGGPTKSVQNEDLWHVACREPTYRQ
ncbi:hypothetical protein TIFTF001_034526 [Ficus carica]|uniref:Uncharacterized protein n=1 Tax=Ficus carica TaxID=3494 RepID=A0AA88DZY5_FICCA|nr:hypothetical protein TIFTF001_034525 [Ficus carica]GMN65457.1 hypothetical protein TIFTF001_034526 [Ficus carica]